MWKLSDELKTILKKNDIKLIGLTRHPNYLLIPVLSLPLNDDGVKIFNKFYLYCKKNFKNKITRTRSRAVSSSENNFIPPMFDIQRNKSSIIELTIISDIMVRIQIRSELKQIKNKTLYGRVAFGKFKKLCMEYGVNLDEMKINNGEQVKAEIERPYICVADQMYYDKIFENAHHIDFHNSYPAGLAFTHKEFYPVIKFLYDKRKYDDQYKAMLNLSIGFMQSIGECHACWAHLARDAIKNNNDRIREIAKRLENNNRVIVGYNTDGIWYVGPIYHGRGEGDDLGMWHNDHVNCKLRFKSAGSYEFIEDGVYYPVVRGYTNLDAQLERSNWKWGDIYKKVAEVKKYYFDEKRGIIENEDC